MKRIMNSASARLIYGFLFILPLVILGDVRTIKAQELATVEGEWEVVSTSEDALKHEIGHRQSIIRKGDGYEVKWLDNGAITTYSGNETRIVRTVLTDLGKHGLGHNIPDSVLQQVAGQKVPINQSYTVSADGNYLDMACDSVNYYYTQGDLRYDHYEIIPGFIKKTFKRVAPPAGKVESQGDHAYAADCGPTVPNRTAPITTDLCPGNLVALSYFCGGDTGCPYVCCPKGLPYLNHCDCKCYAAATDFECGSHSVCQVQQKQ